MNPKQLREWLFQNGQEDQWWLCLDAVTEELPLTVDEIEEYMSSGEYESTRALHVSQSEMSNPPWIDVELPSQASSGSPRIETPIPPAYSATAKQKPQETLGIFMVLLPLISAMLIWFWVGSMTLLQNPGSTLQFLITGTVIATGVLVAIDASQLGIGSGTDKKGRKSSGPVAWAVFTLLFWFVGFPAYLGYRSRHGAKNMVVGGIAVTILFLASAIMMNGRIEEHADEIRRSFELLGICF